MSAKKPEIKLSDILSSNEVDYFKQTPIRILSKSEILAMMQTVRERNEESTKLRIDMANQCSAFGEERDGHRRTLKLIYDFMEDFLKESHKKKKSLGRFIIGAKAYMEKYKDLIKCEDD